MLRRSRLVRLTLWRHLRVRIGLHTGTLQPFGGDYFGRRGQPRRADRESSAHGGQIVLVWSPPRSYYGSPAEQCTTIADEGPIALKGPSARPSGLYRLTSSDLPVRDWPPGLRTLDPQLNNFLAQVTSPIGRRRTAALQAACDTLRPISSPQGQAAGGKTRLAMQVAAGVTFRTTWMASGCGARRLPLHEKSLPQRPWR